MSAIRDAKCPTTPIFVYSRSSHGRFTSISTRSTRRILRKLRRRRHSGRFSRGASCRKRETRADVDPLVGSRGASRNESRPVVLGTAPAPLRGGHCRDPRFGGEPRQETWRRPARRADSRRARHAGQRAPACSEGRPGLEEAPEQRSEARDHVLRALTYFRGTRAKACPRTDVGSSAYLHAMTMLPPSPGAPLASSSPDGEVYAEPSPRRSTTSYPFGQARVARSWHCRMPLLQLTCNQPV
jgi:hypothetical protein